MTSHDPRTLGRLAALLLIAQMWVAPVAHFKLLAPAISASPGFLANAAAHAPAVNAAVLLLFAAALCSVGFALAVFGELVREGRTAATAYVLLSGVGLVLTCVEGASLRAMVAVSEAYAQAGATAVAATFEPSRALLRGVRNTLHYLQLLNSGVALLLLIGWLLWRGFATPAARTEVPA